jgi:hypothetical protein
VPSLQTKATTHGFLPSAGIQKKKEYKTSLLIGLITNPSVLMTVYALYISSFTPAERIVSTKPTHH